MKNILKVMLPLSAAFLIYPGSYGQAENEKQVIFDYTVTMPDPSRHLLHIELKYKGMPKDTIDFKMPVWMPGYYQIMDYPDQVSEFSARTAGGNKLSVIKKGNNTWKVASEKEKVINISYNVRADKRFVANSWLDSTHCYIIPGATFLFCEEYIKSPVTVKVVPDSRFPDIATGLGQAAGKTNTFIASDFDILYDSPILAGKLDEFPQFEINGIVHRFIAYNPGTFDKAALMSALEKSVKEATELIGDIPYPGYTFIGIGPGFGGIEHLNNTTVSFYGGNLDNNHQTFQKMILFLTHEYFHNYNVKRIRPFELGPFDYSGENRTNLLWVSEGLSVYYEYLIVKRAGLLNDDDLFRNLAADITSFENDPGKEYQSLIQSSYNTWSDGPFGKKPGEADRAISYYEKGPVAGLILDFAIRKATDSKKSLDDVMRLVYRKYYKELERGFTDAEFQKACEEIAGAGLSRVFEYMTTTREIDYASYLSLAGLKLSSSPDSGGIRKYSITQETNPSEAQLRFLKSWLNGN